MSNYAKIIDGRESANIIINDLQKIIVKLKEKFNLVPGIATILVGKNPASEIYVRNKLSKASAIGLKTELIRFNEDVGLDLLKSTLGLLNKEKSINGILVQLPLPKHLNPYSVIEMISSAKDVDGFHPYNVGLLNTGQEGIKPCTPQGIVLLLESVYGKDLSGKKVTVVGRSLIVGRPLATMLIQKNCTVTIVHSKTKDPMYECKASEIIIAAAGVPNLITKEWVKKDACLIDVGINKVNGKIIGDANFKDVCKIASYITPVPGGVGPMTIACLLKNTFEACLKQNNLTVEHLL